MANLPQATIDAVVEEASRSPIGFAMREEDGAVCLASRDGDHVFVGVNDAITSWFALKDWDAVIERNFPRLENWTKHRSLRKIHRPRAVGPVSPEERKLLDAIVARPKNDDARLVYADWLLEQSDARGELIALQCQIAKMSMKDPERIRLLERWQRIARINPTVLGPLRGASVTWKRGFIVAARLQPQQINAANFARQPLIEDLTIEHTTKSPTAKLVGTKLLAGVRRLALQGTVAAGRAWPEVLRTADLSSLDTLVFENFTWKHGEALWENPSLPTRKKLRTLASSRQIAADLETSAKRRAELESHGWAYARA
jgi:uncharacterized protein (TIGR02996 family)